MATRLHDDQFDSEQRSLQTILYRRTYRAGPGATLAGLDLELGDALPDDSTAEITESWLDRLKMKGQAKDVWINVARVVAIKFNEGA